MSVTLSEEKKMKLLKLNKLITYSPPSLRRRLLPYLLHATNLSCSSSSPQISPWSGLQAWRDSPLNENRFWGPNGPEALPLSIDDDCAMMLRSTSSLAELGALVLSTSDPLTKSKLSHLAFSKWCTEKLPIGSCVPPSTPARPDIPVLVSPKEVPAPKDSGLPLNAYMLHNLAHVELNAIDLAWDTVVRFSSISQILGEGFFADFAHVADDESRHFAWCSQRLSELGFKYGDMPAHNLLWRECEKSSDNVAARLATIPLVQEARGLDAGPRLVQKLVGCGDHKTSSIVARIADEEIAHVAVGVCWFVSLCQKMNCSPCSTFKGSGAADIINCYASFSNVHELADLLSEYNVEVKGPFNYSAREEAGIPRNWYDKSLPSEQGENKRHVKNEQLSMVYERLNTIISMECQNANSVNPDG